MRGAGMKKFDGTDFLLTFGALFLSGGSAFVFGVPWGFMILGLILLMLGVGSLVQRMR